MLRLIAFLVHLFSNERLNILEQRWLKEKKLIFVLSIFYDIKILKNFNDF